MVSGRGRKTEAVTPYETVERLLAAAGEDMVLVGGQALAFWVLRYDLVVPEGVAAISSDTDFLVRSAADREAVHRMARVIHGRALFPSRRALTALVGQAVLDIDEDEFVNVDVIHKVIGIAQKAIRARAVRATIGNASILVMHPLHVLLSRLTNLHVLTEKQTEKGVMQLQLAVDVGREFIRAISYQQQHLGSATRSPIQPYVSEVERMALTDAGRKVAKRFGIHVADAIDPSSIPAGPFWERKWPQLSQFMSPSYREMFAPPGNDS
ncbi:hypothetical protein SAMN05518845_12575 [Variovorax sp. YR750]|jgi:hypothetical protein|nr:hypothetical protein SAMN03159371_06716 [Variovorax sp. NFACC28]SEG96476.1 hypothetical protein SAMN03159365_06560 [Variovorax sp. NFACC29]SEM44086.1 hypothetical protein SAMN05518845_12575 [Variovorax sp. YR750]SFD98400.1 hypothetical protein SAMN03159379_06979 [Variovorax sp. NFACC26]SFH26571.1 hypothetical protein SAMN03159447_07551 [Variovorax sp. NFACC27]